MTSSDDERRISEGRVCAQQNRGASRCGSRGRKTRCRGAGRTRPHGANLGEPSRYDGGYPRLLAGPGGRRRGGVLPALPRPLGRRLDLHPETLRARGREERRQPSESPRSSVLGGCAAGGGCGRRGFAAASGLEIRAPLSSPGWPDSSLLCVGGLWEGFGFLAAAV
jgi:hypothetical protein